MELIPAMYIFGRASNEEVNVNKQRMMNRSFINSILTLTFIFSKTNLIRSHSGCKFFMPDKNDRWRVLRPLKETRIVENVHVSNNIE